MLPGQSFLILTRESLTGLLPDGADLTQCSTGECEVDRAKRGADYVVVGEVIRFDGAFRLSLKSFNCASSAFLGSEVAAGGRLSEVERGLGPAGSGSSA